MPIDTTRLNALDYEKAKTVGADAPEYDQVWALDVLSGGNAQGILDNLAGNSEDGKAPSVTDALSQLKGAIESKDMTPLFSQGYREAAPHFDDDEWMAAKWREKKRKSGVGAISEAYRDFSDSSSFEGVEDAVLAQADEKDRERFLKFRKAYNTYNQWMLELNTAGISDLTGTFDPVEAKNTIDADKEWAKQFYGPVREKSQTLRDARAYRSELESQNAPMLLMGIKSELSYQAGSILDSCAAAGYKWDDSRWNDFKRLSNEEQEKVVAAVKFMQRPEKAWFGYQALRGIWDMATSPVDHLWDSAVATSAYFTDRDYQDESKIRAYRRALLEKEFSDLGWLGNTAVEAVGIAGYAIPGKAFGYLGRLANVGKAARAGAAVDKAVKAGKTADEIWSAGVASYNATARAGQAITKASRVGIYAVDNQRQYLERIHEQGGDVGGLGVQLMSWAVGVGSGMVEEIQWEGLWSAKGLTIAQTDAYSKIVHSLFGKMAEKYGIRDVAGLSHGSALWTLGKEIGRQTFFESAEEAIQQTMEETVVQVGSGKRLDLGAAMAQGADAFVQSLGPMALTMVVGAPARAYSGAKTPSFSSEDTKQILTAGEKLVDWMKTGSWAPEADGNKAQGEAMKAVSTAFQRWSASEDETDALHRLERMGFSRDDATRMDSVFRSVREAADRISPSDQGASVLPEGAAPESAAEVIARSGRQGRKANIVRNEDGSESIETELTMMDGRKVKLRETVRREEQKDIDLVAETESEARNHVQSLIDINAEKFPSVTSEVSEIVAGRTADEVAKDADALKRLQDVVKKFGLHEAGQTKATNVERDVDGNVTAVDVGISLKPNAWRGTIRHEHVHAIQEVAKAFGLTDEQAKALAESAANDALAPTGSNERWNEERAPVAAEGLRDAAQGPVEELFNWAVESIRGVLGLEKKRTEARNAVDWFLDAMRTGRFGSLDHLENYSEADRLLDEMEDGAEEEKPDSEPKPEKTEEKPEETPVPEPEENVADISHLKALFKMREPLTREQMALLAEATRGLDTRKVWESGYRWNDANKRWEFSMELQKPVDPADLPQTAYMGADGKMHKPSGPSSGERHQIVTARPSPEFAMDGTVVDALPAHLREDGRRIVAERENTPAWMADPDGTPTDLSERDWLRREAERRHGASVTPHGVQKQAGVAYPDASSEIVRFSIGARRREEYLDVLARKRPDLDAESVLAELDKFNDPKKEKVALHWVVRGSLLLPQDAYKIDDALDVAAKAKVDPFAYKSPDELLIANKQFKPTARPIDPATVPELSDPRDEGDGIVSYLVQDDQQGQAAMRRIIDTHWGEDANPWCLLARDKNTEDWTNLYLSWFGMAYPNELQTADNFKKFADEFERRTGSKARAVLSDEERMQDAWYYWNHYSAIPKRVAFKNGKLLAFMATDVYDASRDMFGDEILNRFSPEEADRLRREYEEWHASDEGQEEGADFYEWLDHEHPDVIDQANEAEQWWDRQDESHPDLDFARDNSRYQVASAPSAADLAEARRQYDEVVARYTNPDGTRKPGWLKAPNGDDTHLTERQWVQVRTPAFKAWFGEWENDPANASKVVDENGEPRVMWRGAPFDPLSQAPGKGVIAAERYFTTNEAYARRYEKGAGATRAYFLNVRGPFDVRNARDAARMLELRGGHAFHAGSTGALDWAEAPTAEEIEELWPGEYDGLVLDEGGDPAESGPAYRGESVVPFAGGAQVKSATDNAGTFSARPDVRYSVTPAEDAAYMDAVQRGDMDTAQRMVREVAEKAFPDTKVVDDNGEPLVVFHGTTNEETRETWNPRTRTFDIEHSPFTVFRRRVDGVRNSGAFFNSSEDNAGGYGSRVYKVFLNLRNPLVVDANNSDYSHITHNGATRDTYEWAEWAERNGYDGLIIKNVRDGVDYGAMSSATADYVAFRPSQIKSADPVTYDDAGNVIPLSQRFNTQNEDIRYQISGPIGAEALGIRNLADAEAMERSGANRTAIWRETGWWRGRDGEWRVEIPDLTLKPEVDKDFLVGRSLTVGRIARGEVLTAYPEIADIPIWITNTDENHKFASPEFYNKFVKAAYSKKEDGSPVIWMLDHGGRNVEPFLVALVHEVQHAIQDLEGFAPGGTKESVPLATDEDVDRFLDSLEEKEYPSEEAYYAARREAVKVLETGRGIVIVRRGGEEKIITDYDAYRSLAGEADARLVQKRLGMTPEQRAARPPWEDYDVDEERLIVLHSVAPGRSQLTASYGLWDGRGPQTSGDEYLVGIAATMLLSGKEKGLEAKLAQVAAGLRSEIGAEEAIRKARSLLNTEAAERAAEMIRQGKPRDAAGLLSSVEERNNAEKHVLKAMQRGAQDALRGERDQARALAAILREETGIGSGELTNMTGVDWGRVLHERMLAQEAERQKAIREEAERRKDERENQPAEPTADELLGGDEAPETGVERLTEDEIYELPEDDPRRVAALKRLSAIREKTRRLLEEAKKRVAERRAEEESRAAEAESEEPPLDEDGENGGGDADEEEREPGETEPAEREFSVADALALLEREEIDFADGETVAAFLRVMIGDGIRAETSGGETPAPLSEKEERRFWRNPTVVKQYALSMRNVLQDWARRMLDHGSFTYAQTMRIAQELGHWESATAIEQTCASLVSRISAASIKQTSRQIVEETREYVERAVGGARFSELDPDFTRKVMGVVQRDAQYIRRVLRMSAGDIDRALNGWTDRAGRHHKGIEEILKDRESAYSAAGAAEGEFKGDNDYLWAARRKSLIEEFGGMRDLLPGEAREKAATIREWVDLNLAEFALKMAQRQTSYERDRDVVLRACRRTKADGSDLVYDGPKTKAGQFAKWVTDIPLNTVEQELRDFFKYATGGDAEAARELTERWTHRIAEATQNYEALKQEGMKALEASAKHVFGDRAFALAKWLRHLADPIPEEYARQLSKTGMPQMTYGQALHLYGYLCQTDNDTYRENIEKYERTGQRDIIEQNVLSADDLRMVAELRRIYAGRRADLSAAKERITGIGFGSPSPFYLPVEILTGETNGLRDSRGGGRGLQIMPAVFSDRVKHSRDVDETADAMAIFFSRLEQSARVIAFGDLAIDALHVFGNKDVKDALTRFHGASAKQYFEDHLLDVLSGTPSRLTDANDYISRVAGAAMTVGTYVGLWGNLNTMLKQTVSQYASSLRRRDGDPSVTSDLLRILRNPAKWIADYRELAQSPGYRARYGRGVMDEVARVIGGEGGETLSQRIARIGMQPIQFGDAVGGMLVAVGAYQRLRDDYLEKHPDEGYDAAARWAAVEAMHQNESTQQSSETAYRPNYARRGSMGHRLLMMFSSAANLQASWEAVCLREWRAAADPHGDRNFAESVVATMLDEEARRRFGRYLRAMVVNHVTVPLLMEAVSKLFFAVLGYPPPEPDDELKSIAILVLLGQFGRLAWVGSLMDFALRDALGDKPRSTAPSVFSTMERMAKYGFGAIYDLVVEGDVDAALEDADRFGKQSLAPYRHVRAAIDNYSD